ncbi:MAG TPA: amidophosphoribosyltransferase [Paludibacteraceae bacterium]|nr:amidophosphoribosyltransferase [Paludibacteraceae bacterium]HQF50613.1 amidophosphoribosyltransferase [Paludibacteraceae bacterium]
MCGIAYVRLRKPLEYYFTKYNTWKYGLEKLYLLMEKQHNRGQEGAGLACIKLHSKPGEEYIFRERAEGSSAINEIFGNMYKNYKDIPDSIWNDPKYAEENLPFAGELYMGHLRYSTTGKHGISYVHPFLRRSNWKNRSLVLSGNFNLTNVDEVFAKLTKIGQHPRDMGDTILMLETIGHQLDQEVQSKYDLYDKEGKENEEISELIEKNMNIGQIIRRSENGWDGGYAICGMIGHGDSFLFRDPHGIRPAFYYIDDEIIVAASERPVIQTVMNVAIDDVKELGAGQALIMKRDGDFYLEQIHEPLKLTQCSFERIYFSRGSDRDIYRERKKLGELLTPSILKAVNYDLKHTVFSFIPNTAEVGFYGMMDGMDKFMIEEKKKKLASGVHFSNEEIQEIISARPRMEKIAIKDIKMRTFIAQDENRNDLAAHVYDVTYGSVKSGEDNLVIIDDSIVRGTTLKQSIIKILDKLNPKKIVIVSSSPQVRFPDCYGIDMSRMSEFIAFKAAIELLKERGETGLINDVYLKSKAQQNLPKEQIVNYVKKIYAPFTDEEISRKIAQMLTPSEVKTEVEIVYQQIEQLHEACPNHTGDWYFSGNYPTPGGNRLVNNAFINYIEGNLDKR